MTVSLFVSSYFAPFEPCWLAKATDKQQLVINLSGPSVVVGLVMNLRFAWGSNSKPKSHNCKIRKYLIHDISNFKRAFLDSRIYCSSDLLKNKYFGAMIKKHTSSVPFCWTDLNLDTIRLKSSPLGLSSRSFLLDSSATINKFAVHIPERSLHSTTELSSNKFTPLKLNSDSLANYFYVRNFIPF